MIKRQVFLVFGLLSSFAKLSYGYDQETRTICQKSGCLEVPVNKKEAYKSSSSKAVTSVTIVPPSQDSKPSYGLSILLAEWLAVFVMLQFVLKVRASGWNVILETLLTPFEFCFDSCYDSIMDCLESQELPNGRRRRRRSRRSPRRMAGDSSTVSRSSAFSLGSLLGLMEGSSPFTRIGGMSDRGNDYRSYGSDILDSDNDTSSEMSSYVSSDASSYISSDASSTSYSKSSGVASTFKSSSMAANLERITEESENYDMSEQTSLELSRTYSESSTGPSYRSALSNFIGYITPTRRKKPAQREKEVDRGYNPTKSSRPKRRSSNEQQPPKITHSNGKEQPRRRGRSEEKRTSERDNDVEGGYHSERGRTRTQPNGKSRPVASSPPVRMTRLEQVLSESERSGDYDLSTANLSSVEV